MYQSQRSIFFLVCTVTIIFAEYKEGIDTTDQNGYSHDSLFSITNNGISVDLKGKVFSYAEDPMRDGYLNCEFEDITKAPEKFNVSTPRLVMNKCYVLMGKDTAYSKISVLCKLSDGRYVYRYGKNSEKKNRQLVETNYNQSIRYKPNNLYIYGPIYHMPVTTGNLEWEPPLPGSKELRGYIIYFSKPQVETSKSFDISQWDSIAFTTNCYFNATFSNSRYLNLAAAYKDGKSELINGWFQMFQAISVYPGSYSEISYSSPSVHLEKTTAGYCFDILNLPTGIRPLEFAVYSSSGCLITELTESSRDGKVWNVYNPDFSPGHYIIKAVLTDRRIVSRQFTLVQ
jgi:hypothetical protein